MARTATSRQLWAKSSSLSKRRGHQRKNAPRVSGLVYQARAVSERSRSRSNEGCKKRARNTHEVAGDRYQLEQTEHMAADDLDINIDSEEPHPACFEDPTERLTKVQTTGQG